MRLDGFGIFVDDMAVIGPGGKIIQQMQEDTGATITIEETDGKGHVQVSAPNKDSIDAALAKIKAIVAVPEVGEVYEGIPYDGRGDGLGASFLLHPFGYLAYPEHHALGLVVIHVGLVPDVPQDDALVSTEVLRNPSHPSLKGLERGFAAVLSIKAIYEAEHW